MSPDAHHPTAQLPPRRLTCSRCSVSSAERIRPSSCTRSWSASRLGCTTSTAAERGGGQGGGVHGFERQRSAFCGDYSTATVAAAGGRPEARHAATGRTADVLGVRVGRHVRVLQRARQVRARGACASTHRSNHLRPRAAALTRAAVRKPPQPAQAPPPGPPPHLLGAELDGGDHQVGDHLLRTSIRRNEGDGCSISQLLCAPLRRRLQLQPRCRTGPPVLHARACTLPPSEPGVALRPSTRNLQRAARMCCTACTISLPPAGRGRSRTHGEPAAVQAWQRWHGAAGRWQDACPSKVALCPWAPGKQPHPWRGGTRPPPGTPPSRRGRCLAGVGCSGGCVRWI